jgi:serine/threonine protein kinase
MSGFAAHVKILNFNDSFNLDNLLPLTEAMSISSIEDFLTKLKKSKGAIEKPVRILYFCNNGSLNIVKFSHDMGRNKALRDEIKNNISLFELKDSRHIAKMTWYSIKNKLNTNVMCCEYIPPLRKGILTLRQLAEFGNDDEFRQALFQTLFALHMLQKRFAGFRHNDFKADNVLVSKPPPFKGGRSVYEISDGIITKQFKIYPLLVWIKIIDFEVACTPNGKYFSSYSVMKYNKLQVEKDYGLSPLQCDVFDVHLLFFDIFNVIKENIVVYKHFAEFVRRYIPLELFELKNMTPQFRLRICDQAILHKKLNGNTMIFDMLNDAYFSSFLT